ncbi:MAG: hypothetical protein QMD36_01350 [Candidatus Aenigmarchaeota archaeon]|nr:hypothetical protein [Candidatus Aenigmarchaeota archaeon]
MFRKAVSKWTIAFLAGFILTAGLILMLVVLPGFFRKELCPKAQEEQIQSVWIKVEEMKRKTGYETMYFEVKDCVKNIEYKPDIKKITVNYTTASVSYPTNADWTDTNGDWMLLTEPGTYYFRVFENKVEVLRKV